MSDERISKLEAEVATLKTAIAVTGVTGAGIEKRLDKIEDTLTFLVRLIVGSIILALIGFVVGGGLKS
jgi:uncharacterized protein YlxW (UPF0749 family)